MAFGFVGFDVGLVVGFVAAFVGLVDGLDAVQLDGGGGGGGAGGAGVGFSGAVIGAYTAGGMDSTGTFCSAEVMSCCQISVGRSPPNTGPPPQPGTGTPSGVVEE